MLLPAASLAKPCDIYGAGGTPCVAAHSLTRALYAAYAGPLYRLVRTPGGARADISVLRAGGTANASAHAEFCSDSATCTVEAIYDQSPLGNHLGIEQGMPYLSGPRAAHDRGVDFNDTERSQARLGGQQVFAAHFLGGGPKKRKSFVGQGYSNRTAAGTAVGEEPETIYAVLSGRTFNGGCCFDYGNGEKTAWHTKSDWTNGSMEVRHFPARFPPF